MSLCFNQKDDDDEEEELEEEQRERKGKRKNDKRIGEYLFCQNHLCLKGQTGCAEALRASLEAGGA